MMKALGGIAISILVVVAIFTIGPLLGDKIDSSISFSTNSTWDPSTNTDITSGQSLWETSSGLLLLVVIISLLSVVLFVLMRIGGGAGGI